MTRDRRHPELSMDVLEQTERATHDEERRGCGSRQQHVSIDAAPELFE
ncbi:hypothetical protein [Halostagnicola bangensis]